MLRSPIATRFLWHQCLMLLLIMSLIVNGAEPENYNEVNLNHHLSQPSMYLNALLVPQTGVILTFMSFGSITTLLMICIIALCQNQARSLHRRRNFIKNVGKFFDRAARSTHTGQKELKLYTPEEIELATSNFNPRRLLGKVGEVKTMYIAMLADGVTVVVKRANNVSKNLRELFINEATILTQVNHANIVPLLGFCLKTDHPFLVYKYITGGDLLSFLENAKDEPSRLWRQSRDILRNIADSITHLHFPNGNRFQGICHRNIRLDNILLDKHKNAYLSSFGVAKIQETESVHRLDSAVGKSAYTDPEVWEKLTYTSASDVYSFGVVMVQILSGTSLNMDGLLVPKFMKSAKERSATGVLDPRFDDGQNGDELWNFALVACACLRQYRVDRPQMKEIANVLWGHIPLPSDYKKIKEHDPHLI